MKFTLLLHTFFTITVCFNHFIHTQGTHNDLIYHKSTNSLFLCILSKNDYKMYRLFDLHCYTIPITYINYVDVLHFLFLNLLSAMKMPC